jgi:hypothetical protein
MADICCDPADTFWSDQLAAAKLSAINIQAAIDALTIGGVQMYRLSTGQTDQMVTKMNLTSLHTVLQSTLNRVATLQARLGGCGVIHIVPNS